MNGPEARFTAAVENLYPRVRAYAARHVGDADADDIAAETFVVAWRKLDSVSGTIEVPWLLAIARRLAANHRRAAQRRDIAETNAAAARPSDDIVADDGLLGVLAALSAPDKEILVLVAWGGTLHRRGRRRPRMQSIHGRRPSPPCAPTRTTTSRVLRTECPPREEPAVTDPIAYLRNRNPVAPTRILSGEFRAPQGFAEEVMRRAPRPETTPERTTRGRAWWVTVPVLAAVVVVIAFGLIRGGTTKAGAALDRLAAAAMDERQSLEEGGRIRMTVVTAAGITTVTGTEPQDAFFALGRERTVSTIDADGRMESVTTSIAPTFLGPEDRRRWIASGRMPLGSAGTTRRVSRENPPAAPPSGVTASPASVRARFDEVARDNGHWPRGVAAMVTAREILLVPTLSAEVHVNVFRALASVDGLSTAPGAATPSGHPTTAISVESDYSGADTRYELVFDDTDGRLVGSRSVLLVPQAWVDAEPPVVLESHDVTEFTLLPPTS